MFKLYLIVTDLQDFIGIFSYLKKNANRHQKIRLCTNNCILVSKFHIALQKYLNFKTSLEVLIKFCARLST